MVARLTPDQKVACSIHVGFNTPILIRNFYLFFVDARPWAYAQVGGPYYGPSLFSGEYICNVTRMFTNLASRVAVSKKKLYKKNPFWILMA